MYVRYTYLIGYLFLSFSSDGKRIFLYAQILNPEDGW